VAARAHVHTGALRRLPRAGLPAIARRSHAAPLRAGPPSSRPAAVSAQSDLLRRVQRAGRRRARAGLSWRRCSSSASRARHRARPAWAGRRARPPAGRSLRSAGPPLIAAKP